jgi:glyceraldehyde 3-phosphate dehydrogenase
MNILLNGVGRIGKSILRILQNENDLKVVAINEINPCIENLAYSINYDSTYGRLDDKFCVEENYIKNLQSSIQIINQENIFDIDFLSLNIDIVIDASGVKFDMEKLKTLPLKAIFLTHPNNEADINVVLGVNEDKLDDSHKVISTSSCNATALLPLLKLLDDEKGIEYGDIITIHPLLNHQKTLDSGCVGSSDREIECNFEFGRSATQNIIPSGTTTIEACSYVMPQINKELISSSSLRVPAPTVGAINVTLSLKEKCSKDELLEIFENYEKNQEFDILMNNSEALVSSDFEAERFTTIVDNRYIEVIQDRQVKVVLWYDNEFGYASKVVDIMKRYVKS